MKRDPRDEELARIAGLPLSEAEQIALSLPLRVRLAVAAWAFEILRENWRQGGTYRALLDLLGVEGMKEVDAYRLLMAAGGLDLNNGLPDEFRADVNLDR